MERFVPKQHIKQDKRGCFFSILFCLVYRLLAVFSIVISVRWLLPYGHCLKRHGTFQHEANLPLDGPEDTGARLHLSPGAHSDDCSPKRTAIILSKDVLLEELSGIRESWVKRNGAGKGTVIRKLEEMNSLQEKIWGIIESIQKS